MLVFPPDGKLPVCRTLLKVTKRINFIAKPKSVISCTPCVHDQLTTAEVATHTQKKTDEETETERRDKDRDRKARREWGERERQRERDAVLMSLAHVLGYYTVTYVILGTESF